MIQTIYFLEFEDVLFLNQQQIELYGGLFGLRDESLLKSALEMPKQGFGDTYFHEFPFGMAAAYLFHISKNHPFLDGNKRTALMVMLTFLDANKIELTCEGKILEDLAVDVATGKYSKDEISKFLEKNSKKI